MNQGYRGNSDMNGKERGAIEGFCRQVKYLGRVRQVPRYQGTEPRVEMLPKPSRR